MRLKEVNVCELLCNVKLIQNSHSNERILIEFDSEKRSAKVDEQNTMFQKTSHSFILEHR